MREREVPLAWSPEISAARNEWESFQVIVTGAPKDLEGVLVSGTGLRGPKESMIAAPRVLREHYVRVAKNSERASLPPGDYPDALVPQSFPVEPLTTHQPSVNQPFWIDVYVPPDALPGDYQGTLEVRTADHQVITVDYTLHVWNFVLPRAPSLRSSMFLVWRRVAEMHGFDRSKSSASPALQQLLDAYYDMLAEHRLAPHEIWASYPLDFDPLSDTSFAHMERGIFKHVRERQPSTIGLPLWFDWPLGDPLGKDREAAMDYCVRFYRICEKAGASSRLYKMFGELDEPNTAEKYAQVRQWGAFFREIETKHGVRIPMLVTEGPKPRDPAWGTLVGAPRIWVPHVTEVWLDSEAPQGPKLLPQRLAAGDEVWTYTALAQTPQAWLDLHGNPSTVGIGQPPVWLTDYPPLNHRILSWLMPIQGVTGITYWDMAHWKGGDAFDPWQDNGTYPHTNDSVYNGDGFFIYPARQQRHGREGPVASIRLKWLRESADDYDYQRLLIDRGFKNTVLDLTQNFARGFGDWDDDLPALYEARARLAQILEKLNARDAAPR